MLDFGSILEPWRSCWVLLNDAADEFLCSNIASSNEGTWLLAELVVGANGLTVGGLTEAVASVAFVEQSTSIIRAIRARYLCRIVRQCYNLLTADVSTRLTDVIHQRPGFRMNECLKL